MWDHLTQGRWLTAFTLSVPIIGFGLTLTGFCIQTAYWISLHPAEQQVFQQRFRAVRVLPNGTVPFPPFCTDMQGKTFPGFALTRQGFWVSLVGPFPAFLVFITKGLQRPVFVGTLALAITAIILATVVEGRMTPPPLSL